MPGPFRIEVKHGDERMDIQIEVAQMCQVERPGAVPPGRTN